MVDYCVPAIRVWVLMENHCYCMATNIYRKKSIRAGLHFLEKWMMIAQLIESILKVVFHHLMFLR